MGDRTYHSLTVYACPEEDEARKALAVLAKAGYLAEDLEHDESEDAFTLALGPRGYTIQEAYVGTTSETVAALIEAAPSIVLDATEDAAYGAAGARFAYTPGLGLWETAYADEDYFSVPQVRAILAAETTAERELLIGATHQDAINTYREHLRTLPEDERRVIVHNAYPHFPGRLYDCAACEAACYCTPGDAECIYDGEHNGTGVPAED